MIRAAIIGLGRWGQIMVNSVQGKSDAIRFTAGVTRTVSKAVDFAEQHSFPLGEDYEAVLGDPNIDAIVLATPHTQHAEQIVRAAAVGKHVFVVAAGKVVAVIIATAWKPAPQVSEYANCRGFRLRAGGRLRARNSPPPPPRSS